MLEILELAKLDKKFDYKTYNKYKELILDISNSIREYEEGIIKLSEILEI